MSHEKVAAPAQTYDLNIVASILGRYAVPSLDQASRNELSGMAADTTDMIRTARAPEVPHTAPELLRESINFDQKLLTQLDNGPASELMNSSQRSHIRRLILGHMASCQSMLQGNIRQDVLVEPSEIANAYGLNTMWSDGERIVAEEAKRWQEYATHPAVPEDLMKQISNDETKQLLELMWHYVIEEETSPDVNVYLTDTPQDYHVFWAPLANGLDYTTPRQYDRAIQLSFDLPHNATHLAHLAAIGNSGSDRYDDNMSQRAYFEAATVFSEFKATNVAQDSPDFTESMADIYKTDMSPANLANWVVQDRGYEFKLRAARYMADLAMVQGARFDEAVAEIVSVIGVPHEHAEKEAMKYLPWTGLGAAYTFGYRKLVDKGISSVQQVLRTSDGRAITSWEQQDQIRID